MGLISKNKPKQQAKNSAPHDHNLLAGTHGPRSGIRHKEEPREQHDCGKWPYKTRKPLKRAALETVRQNNAGQTYRKPVLRCNRWREQGTVKWAKSHGARNGSNYQEECQKTCHSAKRLGANVPCSHKRAPVIALDGRIDSAYRRVVPNSKGAQHGKNGEHRHHNDIGPRRKRTGRPKKETQRKRDTACERASRGAKTQYPSSPNTG